MNEGNVRSCMESQYNICQGSFVLNTCCKEGSRDQCELKMLSTAVPAFDFYTFTDASASECRCPFSDNSDKIESEKVWE